MSKVKASPFDETHYNSGDGMMTSIWGPPLWHTLHTISFNYPVKPSKEQRETYMNFFDNAFKVLPCRFCRENAQKHLIQMPITKKAFKNRESLSRWVYELHEIVNDMLGKKSGLSYEDIRDRYEGFRSRCINPTEEIKTEKKEGCTEPLYGMKGKTVLHIVPKTTKCESLVIDKKCRIKRKK